VAVGVGEGMTVAVGAGVLVGMGVSLAAGGSVTDADWQAAKRRSRKSMGRVFMAKSST
jgi:hypothetical protein